MQCQKTKSVTIENKNHEFFYATRSVQKVNEMFTNSAKTFKNTWCLGLGQRHNGQAEQLS
jgi:hypothetical protein